jgi:hypothetical protein
MASEHRPIRAAVAWLCRSTARPHMTVRRYLIFQSEAFNTSERKDYFINDCCFGDDLARWLIERLRARGLQTDSEPGQEDFGWYLRFRTAKSEYCFILGYRPSEDAKPGDWMCSIERETGMLGWLLYWTRKRKIEPEAVQAIHAVVSESPQISGVRWFTDEDYAREENGQTTPTTV